MIGLDIKPAMEKFNQRGGEQATASIRPPPHRRRLLARSGDFHLPQNLAQAARGGQRALDVFVGGGFLEEQHHLAAGALPGIAALNPARPVPKHVFAPGAADLN